MSDPSKWPEKEFRVRSVSCAIWRTQINRDGRNIDRFSIKIQKRYRDRQTGEWKGTELHLFPADLFGLVVVAWKAISHCMLKQSEEPSELAPPVAT